MGEPVKAKRVTEISAAVLAIACSGSREPPPAPPFATVFMPAPRAGAPAGAVPEPTREPELDADPACERDDSPDAQERAKLEYQRGITALQDKRYEEAIDGLRAAYVRICANRLLFLIGVAQEGLGQLDAARSTIREYQQYERSDIGRRRAKSYLACIDRRLSGETLDCLAEERTKPP
jgi:tetratricopeptide (TPR) repeat protein